MRWRGYGNFSRREASERRQGNPPLHRCGDRSDHRGLVALVTPSVGRIVHYTSLGDADGKYPPEQQAAIVTRVLSKTAVELRGRAPEREHDFLVSLAILYPTGLFWMVDVPFSSDYKRGHWSWPPRAGGA